MKNSLHDFKSKFLEKVLDGLWAQWSALGVPGHGRRESGAVIDPEALLLLTCSFGRFDARLFDEVIDWMVLHERLIDVQRLKNMLRDEQFSGGRVLAAIAGHLSDAKRGGVKWGRLTVAHGRGETKSEPLFYSPSGEPIPVIRDADPAFALYGLQREKVKLRNHAQLFNPESPSALRLKLRALFGVNSRAETVAYLLLHKEANTAEIASASYYFKLTIHNALVEMRLSGLVQQWGTDAEHFHRLKGPCWEHFPRGDWFNWAPLFRMFEHIWITLTEVERRQMDSDLLATELHQLQQKIAPLSQRAGAFLDFPVPSADTDAYVQSFLRALKGLLSPLW